MPTTPMYEPGAIMPGVNDTAASGVIQPPASTYEPGAIMPGVDNVPGATEASPETPNGPTPLVVAPPSPIPSASTMPAGSNNIPLDEWDAATGGSSSPITATSGNARTDESNLGSSITTMSDPNYQSAPNTAMNYLDQYQQDLNSNTSPDAGGINADFDAQESELQNNQNAETGQESSTMARAGGYLGPSASGNGVLLGLAATHRTQMQALEAARQTALSNAATAYQTKDFALAQAKVSEAQGYETQAQNLHQTFLNNTAAVQKTQLDLANQTHISALMAQGITNPNQIFQKLNGAVPIADIESFIKSATPAAAAGSAFNFTTADTAKLLGAGLSTKDIANVNAYVTQNGYTDQFRASLTPSERQVLDSIYLPKVAAAKAGSSATASGTVKFTASQLAKGAANAGLSIASFKALASDDQNQFINSYSAFSKDLTAIGKGTETKESVWSNINSSNLSDAVKAIYKKKLGITDTPTDGSADPGFFKDLEDWAGGAWKTITGA